ncbi:MAG: DUF1385 domain-containing protein [Negativibacillus sp.]|nr:DUF1385 domain-containing protein [Negativibacillus sp.]
MSKQTNSNTIKTSIGGQAVIEGVMMRGPKLTALSVRMPDQSISTEVWDTPNSNKWYKKTPFIRGVFNFVESLTDGYKSLMKAAEKAGLDEEEEEPSKFEQKLRQLLGDKFMPFLQGCILLFSLAMALFFFAFLPTTLVGFFKDYISHPLALSALEGLTKIAILILYLALISNMSDIKRVFMYHGAEHKTIFCYEHGEELTVENVRKYTRFHPRCGTSFLVIVLLLSILVSSMVSWDNLWMRVGLKVLCLPIIMSLSYECIKFAGRHDNLFTRILSAPGLWTQRLTTREPDDSMIEVAIASMKKVIPENPNEALF